jgi:hypothetical protein
VIKRSDNPLDRIPESPRSAFPIWIAFLAPPVTAILHLQFSYPLDHVACDTGTRLQLHIFSIVALLIDILAGALARREWVRLGAESPDQLPGPPGSRRLMAQLGMIGAGIFALFIIAQWFPNFVLAPCIRT